jgi:hypothetical protein
MELFGVGVYTPLRGAYLLSHPRFEVFTSLSYLAIDNFDFTILSWF